MTDGKDINLTTQNSTINVNSTTNPTFDVNSTANPTIDVNSTTNSTTDTNSTNSLIIQDAIYCFNKHTANFDGFRGSAGDFRTIQCMIDQNAERIARKISQEAADNNSIQCNILAVTEIIYDNPALNNANSVEEVLTALGECNNIEEL